jgi:hypothetical protein
MTHPTPVTVLVAAPTGNAIGSALATGLQQHGWQVTVADSPKAAAQCENYAFCVVALSPETRDDPLIAAALRPMRGRLIPLFLASMALPPAHWATAPIQAQGTLEATMQAVITTLSAMPAIPAPTGAAYVHYTAPRPQLPSQRYRRRRLTGGGMVVLVAIGIIAYLLKTVIFGQ